MRDLVQSIDLGVSHQRGGVTRPKAWLQNEVVRVGLAELLCTYVMMVRQHHYKRCLQCFHALTACWVKMCKMKQP